MSAVPLELWHRVQQFLFLEARLLDERRFEEWLGLYAPDAEYWVPAAWQQASAKDHVSLFYETVPLLRMRVERLASESAPLESPQARTNHHLSNLIARLDKDETLAQGYLLLVEYRRGEQRWFSGRVSWSLRAAGETFRIHAKRVDLLNADQESGHLRFAIPF